MALGNDDVGVLAARLDEGDVHGPHRAQVLADDRFQAALALLEVALQPADEAQVAVGVDEDLDVHQVAQGLLAEDQDALDDDDLGRLLEHALGQPGVGGEIVDRHLDGPAGDELAQVPDHQVGLQGVGVVEVDLGPLGERQVADVLVVSVVLDHDHLGMVDGLHDGVGDGRLARGRAAGDPDDQRLARHGDMIAQAGAARQKRDGRFSALMADEEGFIWPPKLIFSS